MRWLEASVEMTTRGKGLYEFTDSVESEIRRLRVRTGMCYLFLPHTSASLVISENYDPTARKDLEAFMDHLVPENQPWERHTLEGSDDSPSHMRAMLTQVSLTIPVDNGQLNLGTWQGIYLFEHRTRPHHRQVLLRLLDATEESEQSG